MFLSNNETWVAGARQAAAAAAVLLITNKKRLSLLEALSPRMVDMRQGL